jgi:hypothetical protein
MRWRAVGLASTGAIPQTAGFDANYEARQQVRNACRAGGIFILTAEKQKAPPRSLGGALLNN